MVFRLLLIHTCELSPGLLGLAMKTDGVLKSAHKDLDKKPIEDPPQYEQNSKIAFRNSPRTDAGLEK